MQGTGHADVLLYFKCPVTQSRRGVMPCERLQKQKAWLESWSPAQTVLEWRGEINRYQRNRNREGKKSVQLLTRSSWDEGTINFREQLPFRERRTIELFWATNTQMLPEQTKSDRQVRLTADCRSYQVPYATVHAGSIDNNQSWRCYKLPHIVCQEKNHTTYCIGDY